jgi:hypothetical protein
MRRIIGLVVGAALGSGLAYYYGTCSTGACPLTSSWIGGAIVGGLLGMFVVGGCPVCSVTSCRTDKPPMNDSKS